MIHRLTKRADRAQHQCVIHAHLNGIQTQLGNGTADDGFRGKRTLRSAEATHSMGDGLICKICFCFQTHIGNFIRAGEMLRKQAMYRSAISGIRARIQHRASIEGKNFSLFAEAHFHMSLDAMPLICAC